MNRIIYASQLVGAKKGDAYSTEPTAETQTNALNNDKLAILFVNIGFNSSYIETLQVSKTLLFMRIIDLHIALLIMCVYICS